MYICNFPRDSWIRMVRKELNRNQGTILQKFPSDDIALQLHDAQQVFSVSRKIKICIRFRSNLASKSLQFHPQTFTHVNSHSRDRDPDAAVHLPASSFPESVSLHFAKRTSIPRV
ncbi:hypothetical protein GBA52_001169 [Prunus armeniaca]|nr:hypothetical protein GBA52_001169 [Prunus armeniaca]